MLLQCNLKEISFISQCIQLIEKVKRSRVKLDKTSKFDRMPNNIKIVKILRFLEYHGLHFEFDSSSFNYSMAILCLFYAN